MTGGEAAVAASRMPHIARRVLPDASRNSRLSTRLTSADKDQTARVTRSSRTHSTARGRRDTPHPPRCWTLPGHERCALEAAALHAERRAFYLRNAEPTPEAVAVALAQLGERALTRTPVPRKRRDRRPGLWVLTPDEIQLVCDLYGVNGGEIGLVTMRQLGELFGVSRTTIQKIIRGYPQANNRAANPTIHPSGSGGPSALRAAVREQPAPAGPDPDAIAERPRPNRQTVSHTASEPRRQPPLPPDADRETKDTAA